MIETDKKAFKDMITIGKATLHNIDCMEYMKSLPDNAFDLAIVDPPYGIEEITGKESANNRGKMNKQRILFDPIMP